MKNLSLKMDDNVFDETEKILIKVRKNRNRYINDAVNFYNTLQNRRILTNQLKMESRLVRDESMEILGQFENLSDES